MLRMLWHETKKVANDLKNFVNTEQFPAKEARDVFYAISQRLEFERL